MPHRLTACPSLLTRPDGKVPVSPHQESYNLLSIQQVVNISYERTLPGKRTEFKKNRDKISRMYSKCLKSPCFRGNKEGTLLPHIISYYTTKGFVVIFRDPHSAFGCYPHFENPQPRQKAQPSPNSSR